MSSYQPALYAFKDGSVLFLKDNPWKGSTDHRVYQFCLICGQKMFTRGAWRGVEKNFSGKSLTICDSSDCLVAFHELLKTTTEAQVKSALNGQTVAGIA